MSKAHRNAAIRTLIIFGTIGGVVTLAIKYPLVLLVLVGLALIVFTYFMMYEPEDDEDDKDPPFWQDEL